MYRVLIADDERIERVVLRQTLEETLGDRCVIYEAENGREALECYEREHIQIAILDIEMPGINGIEAAERIRQKDRYCCIIFLTAFDEFSYARKAITVRALDYLLKPYDEKELFLVLEEAMRQTDENQKYAAPEMPEEENVDKPAAWNREKLAEAGILGEAEGSGSVRLNKVAEMLYEYIKENYMYDISMQELARTMNYSEAYFCKLFKQCFDKNFTAYLTEYRVNEAKKMLEQPTVNVKNVGKAVGYGDSNYFAKVFKRITGQTPTEYRVGIYQSSRL